MPLDSMPCVACIVTAYYPRSHADVIVSKLLADFTHPAPRNLDGFDFHQQVRDLTEAPLPTDAEGNLRRPRLRVISLYIDQAPANDISREWATRAGVPIFPTVREALTLGGADLAVDGVLIIGEHGDYPTNARGQKEYPRRRLFEEVVTVLRESGRAVPIFNDKHLGYAWADAKWMYDAARSLGAPLAAGSSISTTPVGWRQPALALPLGVQLVGALAVGYGPVEAYGFHTLEVLQCMVERRAGGETGVAAVQALSGEAMWEAGAAGQWDAQLLSAALATEDPPPAADPRRLAPHPVVFLLEYRDGLRSAVCMLDGAVRNWLFAARLAGAGEWGADVVATRFRSHSQEPFGHFAYLVEEIQDLVSFRRAPHPVERTLLTTGILDRVMESLWQGGIRLETPELAIHYRLDADGE
ncbi:MAG: hypothetical protein ACR2JY_11420 [Chloroflexota bacterium]